MGWLGLVLMYWGSPIFPKLDDFWTQYVMTASVLIWGVGSILLRKSGIHSWCLFGMASPLIGALLVAPPASFAFVWAKAYVAVPWGGVTGGVMYGIVGGANRSDPELSRRGMSGGQ